MSETQDYRLTKARPVNGIMRAEGSTVQLTAEQYEAEARWGGLEPVDGKAAPVPARTTRGRRKG